MTTFLPPEQVGVAALLVFRFTGMMWTAPLFSARPVPMQIRLATLVVLTLVMLPAATAGALPDAVPGGGFTAGLVNPVSILGELTVGIVLGLGAGILIAAAESAGDMVAVQMGLSGANVLNPLSSTQMPILGQFMGLFSLSVILAVGGHLVILGALADSLALVPVGSPLAMAEGGRAFVGLGTELFVLGLRFAAPVIAAMMIGNAALGVMARTVPQLNVLMVSFPMQIAIGLFTLSASLPLMARFIAGFEVHYGEVLTPLLQALTPTPGGA